jgi:hypothetical protein
LYLLQATQEKLPPRRVEMLLTCRCVNHVLEVIFSILTPIVRIDERLDRVGPVYQANFPVGS